MGCVKKLGLLTLREEHRLRVFEVLRIIGPKIYEVTRRLEKNYTRGAS
jgi:hypothetical protein